MSDSHLAELSRYARDTILSALDLERLAPDRYDQDETMQAPGASFVTLRQGANLRGCIGSTTAFRSLWSDVADNALGAAFRDPRFDELRPEECKDTRLEVSVLSAPTRLKSSDSEHLFELLKPGIDGVIVTHETGRATYLPGVWEHFETAQAFVSSLCQKAKIGSDVPLPEMVFERYFTAHSRWLPLLDGAIQSLDGSTT